MPDGYDHRCPLPEEYERRNDGPDLRYEDEYIQNTRGLRESCAPRQASCSAFDQPSLCAIRGEAMLTHKTLRVGMTGTLWQCLCKIGAVKVSSAVRVWIPAFAGMTARYWSMAISYGQGAIRVATPQLPCPPEIRLWRGRSRRSRLWSNRLCGQRCAGSVCSRRRL